MMARMRSQTRLKGELECPFTSTDATRVDVFLKSLSWLRIAWMNSIAPLVVMKTYAGFCPPFHVGSPLTLETCPLHAAHPPGVSPELHSLTAVCCIMEIKFWLQLQTEIEERDRERGTK